MNAAERAALLVRANDDGVCIGSVIASAIQPIRDIDAAEILRQELTNQFDAHAREAVAAALDWGRGPVSGERLVEIAEWLAEDKELSKNMTEDSWGKTMIAHFDDLFQHMAWMQQLLADATTDGDVTRRWEIEDAAERRGYERGVEDAIADVAGLDLGPDRPDTIERQRLRNQIRSCLTRQLDAKEAT